MASMLPIASNNDRYLEMPDACQDSGSVAQQNRYKWLQDAIIENPSAHLPISECDCEPRLSRIGGPDDDRRWAENCILSAVRQFFYEKKKLKICAIGPKDCGTELVIHAILTKIEKSVHWVLVDDFLRASDFIRYAQGMASDTTVEEKKCCFDSQMMQSDPPVDIDVFVTIDGASWGSVGSIIEQYMKSSSKPTFALTDENRLLLYCQGNSNACIKLSYVPSMQTSDVRPTFLFQYA